MTNPSDAPRTLLHRGGWASILVGPARLRAFRGIGAPASRRLALTALLSLCALAFTAAPALAAAPETPYFEVTSRAATEVGLRGVLNPGSAGEAGSYEFLYNKSATECEHGSHSVAGLANGVQGEEVFETLQGLEPGAQYTVCLLAENGAHQKTSSAPATFTQPAETPETKPADPIVESGATLHGVLNPKQAGEPETWEFAYRQSATECQGGEPGEEKKAPEPAEAALGVKGEAKEAPVTGLLPGTQYTFCLIARNSLGEPAVGNLETLTTLAVAPTISSEFATTVEASAATLNASIDPGGVSTTYHFEYLTEAQFNANGETFAGATSTPESASIGADNTAHPVTTRVTGLTSGTTYYYRVVATNAKSPGGTPGPGKAFTTAAAASSTTAEACPNEQLRAEQPYGLGLPDCRAYEMVSPVEKSDNDAIAPDYNPLHARSSVSGEAITYQSLGAFADPAGSLIQNQYVSRRGPDGWSTQNITPPMGSLLGEETFQTAYQNLLFTPELSSGVATVATSPGTPTPGGGAPEGYVNLYVTDLAERSYRAVTATAPPEVKPDEFVNEALPGAFPFGGPFIAGASTDLSHVVFDSYGKLTPNAQPDTNNIYEWTNGQLQLVNVENDGTGMTGGAQSGAGTPFSSTFGGGANQSGAVSSDGSRIFFTSPIFQAGTSDYEEEDSYSEDYDDFDGEEPVFEKEREYVFPKPQLYVREDGTTTVEVSASKRTDCADHDPCSGIPEPDPNGPRPAFFWMASADGSKVFFTSTAELTDDANTGPDDNAPNLYEYDLETSKLTDLTPDSNPGDPKGAAVLGVATESEDGSYVYFVAKGDLAAGAVSGAANLYVSHDGTTRFIAKLSASRDNSDWSGYTNPNSLSYPAGTPSRQAGPSLNTVAVTPDGTHFAFESTEKLTGYENEPAEPGECKNLELQNLDELNSGNNTEGPCKEIFSYDAVSGSLVCASCNPSGARPVGASSLSGGDETSPQQTLFYIPRNFSEDGSRLFFNSEDALLPQDSNGQQNVYEYEGGHVYPLSNMAGRKGSVFLDASPSGDDVFIATADQLLPQDTDQRIDVYDVRVGGGFPVTPTVAACENADSCKAPESPQPTVFGAPASATFSGAGNVAPQAPAPAVKAKQKPKPKKPKPKKKKRKTKKKRKGHASSKRAANGASKGTRHS